MDLRILGPTEVRHDGSPVALRGAKPRQLLVLLAMRANHPVPAERLIEELWEDAPPPSAGSALRVHLGRLRQVLELERGPNTASARLPAGQHGYVLRLEPDELDAERFERRILAAREANDEGHPARAIPLLTEALDLWRGPAVADIRDLSAARSEVVRLEELHAAAFEELGAARLALGEHALVVDVLSTAVHLYPMREELVAALMLALYRSDRTADALRVYVQLEGRLEELGARPSKALQNLEGDILLQRPSPETVGARAAAGPAPLHLHAPAVPLVGRAGELQELLAAADEPPGDRPRLLLVAGPAGIGKTTLLDELGRRLELRGRRVLAGACELHVARPYQPVVQILDPLLADGTASPFEAMDERTEAGSDLEPSSDSLDTGTTRLRLFEAITDVVARVEAGAVVTVEDIHWADRPTLLLLRHLVRHPRLRGVTFVCTYRDDDIPGERLELVQSLASPSHTVSTRLAPFHENEVRTFVRAVAPPERVTLLAEHAAQICAVTNGNPFFLRELLRELDDEPTPIADRHELTQILAKVAPAGIRALVERRIARLSAQSRGLVHAAAMLDDGITVEILSAICSLTETDALNAVEESLASRLLIEDLHSLDRFVFPHALVRNAISAQIPGSERTALHVQIARTLAAHPDASLVAVARHFCEAAPEHWTTEAATYAEMAGSESERHLMFAEAASWYEEAIRWLRPWERGTVYGRLQLALGRALANDKQLEGANRAFLDAAHAARRAGDSALLVEVALAADGPWISGSNFRLQALSLLEEALAQLDRRDDRRRVKALVKMASALYYVDADREGAVVREALQIAGELDDPEALASARLALHRWYTHDPGASDARLALGSEARAAASPETDGGRTYLLLTRELLGDLLEAGDMAAYRSMLDRYETDARRLLSPPDIYWAMAQRATEATVLGDLLTAEQLARGAALRGYELEQLSAGTLVLQRFVIRYQQARLAEEVKTLRQASKFDTVFVAGAALAAMAMSETGNHVKAVGLVRQVLGPDGSGLPNDVFWLAAMALFGGVAARSEDRDLQHLLIDHIAPFQDHVAVFGVGGAVLGSVHQWLGCLHGALGHRHAAAGHLEEAQRVAEHLEAPFWIAQAQFDRARVLAEREGEGERTIAAELLETALATARRWGFGRILRDAPAP